MWWFKWTWAYGLQLVAPFGEGMCCTTLVEGVITECRHWEPIAPPNFQLALYPLCLQLKIWALSLLLLLPALPLVTIDRLCKRRTEYLQSSNWWVVNQIPKPYRLPGQTRGADKTKGCEYEKVINRVKWTGKKGEESGGDEWEAIQKASYTCLKLNS